MEVSPVNFFNSATRVPNLPLSSIKTFPYQEMLKLFIVGISKSEGGLWAKSNSKVLYFSPSTERRDFRS